MKFCPKCERQYPNDQRLCPDDGAFLSLRDPYNLIGRTLADKYRLEALAGIGGMGAVYSAHQVGPERRVAVKILLPNLVLSDKQAIEFFDREAKMSGQFLHDNVAIIFDAGRTTDEIAYIAMEWLDGHTLEAELSMHAPLSFERTGEILRQIAAGLEAAHSISIIHRDLKPSNIMLVTRQDGRERIKILDFGLGKVLTQTLGSSVSGAMGTPRYASPEQLRTGGNIDQRTDIYSLGVMLYEMLTGLLPFNAPSMYELVRLQQTSSPMALCRIRSDAPVAAEELINRMLSYDVTQRPETVAEVARLFERVVGATQQTPDVLRITSPSPSGIHTAITVGRGNENPAALQKERQESIETLRSGDIRRKPAFERGWQLARQRLGPLLEKLARPLPLVLLATSILVALIYWFSLRPLSQHKPVRLAILPFENLTGDSRLDILERALPTLLAARISQVPRVEVKTAEEVFKAFNALRLPSVAVGRRLARIGGRTFSDHLEVAKRLNADFVVTAQITKTAGVERYIEYRIDDVKSGEISSDKVTWEGTKDIIRAADVLARRIARANGLNDESVPNLARLTTASFEALSWFQIGHDKLLTRDHEGAVTSFENATKWDDKFALAFLHLGRAFRQLRNRVRAEEALGKAMELRDRVGERDRMLIEGYYEWFRLNEQQKGNESFERMLTKFPGDKEALLSLAIIHRELRQYDRSIEFARRAANEVPQFGAAWNTLGYSYLLKRDYVNAIHSFSRFAEVEPGDPNPYDSLGKTLVEGGLYDDAIWAYKRSFEIKPDFYESSALWKLAEVYFLKGDLTEASANAEQFLRKSTGTHRYLGELTHARMALYQGKLAKALEHFKRTRALDLQAGGASISFDAFWHEALLLTGLRKYDKAFDRLRESIKPSRWGSLYIEPYLHALLLNGDRERALKEFAELGVRSFGKTDFNLRAMDAQSRGDYATAIDLWKNLKEKQPGGSLGYELGLAYFGSGQKDEAERELRDLVKARPVPDLDSLSPVNPLYDTRFILGHYELARVLDSQGKTAEAARYYKEFLSFWGSADFELTEIAQAKSRVASPGATGN